MVNGPPSARSGPLRSRLSLPPRLVILAGVLLYWGALFVGTHLPGNDRVNPQEYVQHLDKVVHAGAFAGLGLLVALGASGWWPAGPRLYLAVLVLLAVYGAVDEYTQGMVSRRTSDPRDWLADMAGAIAGLTLFAALRWLFAGRLGPVPAKPA